MRSGSAAGRIGRGSAHARRASAQVTDLELTPIPASGLRQSTKHGVGTFSEALRQEITSRYVRSSLIEPGATATELVTHVREEVHSQLRVGVEQTMEAADVADAIVYIVTRPRHVVINEILIRPTEQVR
jgi:NADP-dependent 3-hydroxy acid dehydrogenase YdfG